MNRRLKKGVLIGGIILIIIILLNSILSNVVSQAVNSKIEEINAKGRISVKIEKIKLDLIRSKLVIKNLSFKPSNSFFEEFKQGNTHKSTVGEFDVSEFKIKGFSIFKILFLKDIITEKIIVNGLELNIYKSDSYLKKNEGPKKKMVLDSLHLKGINQLDLGSIEVGSFKLNIFHAQSGDTLFKYQDNEFIVNGVGLKPFDSLPHYFRFHKDDLNINFNQQKIELNSGYDIHLGNINYIFKEKKVNISNIQLKPIQSKVVLASSYKYNSEVFIVDTKKLDIYGIHIDSIVRTGVVEIDSLVVDKLNLNVYKDQTKPFNLEKRPLFLNQKLKVMRQPINIESIIVKNSFFLYEEKHEDTEDLMTIMIADLDAEINNITSIKDSLNTEKELTINLKGKLNKTAALNLDISMPYNSYSNSFSFSGQVGNAKFSDFNSAIYPALGAKIDRGDLESVRFSVYGNPQGTKGNMTMRYSDVEANFFKTNKKNKGEKNKTISWITNTVIATQNPTPKGKVKTALIEFERIPYKGFGNLIWKSFMSGMMNTMIPFGKQVKESKIIKEKRKEQNKEDRKEKRLQKEIKND